MANSEGRKIWTWENIYSPDETYARGRFAREGGYLGFSNQPTNDPIAPQRLGSAFDLYQGTIGSDQATTSQVVTGIRVTTDDDGYFLNNYEVNTIAGNNYTIYFTEDPENTTSATVLNDFVAATTGWQTVTLSGEGFVVPNTTFDLFAVIQEPDPTPSTEVINYDYTKPNNETVPLTGQITHSVKNLALMNVSKTDFVGGDRAAFLLGLNIGDVIEGSGVRWSVQAITDQGSYVAIAVAPAQQGGTIGAQDFNFETTVPTPITYAVDAGHWAASDNIKGVLTTTGGIQDRVVTDDAQGVNVNVTKGSSSAAWDLVAYSPEFGANKTSGVLDFQEVNWVKASTANITEKEVATTDNTWTEIGRFGIPASSGIKSKFSLEGKRTDALGYFVGEYGLLVYRNGSTEIPQGMSTILRKTTQNGLDFRAEVDGNELVLEVKGRLNQDWDWNITIFFNEVGN